jgi:hypothetical protein
MKTSDLYRTDKDQMLMSRFSHFTIFDSSETAPDSKIKIQGSTSLTAEKSMRFVNYVSHISADFMMEESGASLMESVLLCSLISVVFALCLLALNKDA